MSVAKVIEITAESTESFEAAIREGIKRAGETVKKVKSAWIKDQQVMVENGEITTYRVSLKVTFIIAE
ncbi:dodecin family protein [Acidobacteriota bacterium]